jgi:hypothetical protein
MPFVNAEIESLLRLLREFAAGCIWNERTNRHHQIKILIQRQPGDVECDKRQVGCAVVVCRQSVAAPLDSF